MISRIKKQNLNIPEKPGVYYWKDANDNIIYIGKAKNLKKRISDYLNFRTHSFLINHLFKIANSIDWLVLKSEKDALIKEAQEINKYQPRLNIRLKYSKPFKYLGIFLQKKNIQIKLVNSYTKHKNSFCLGPFSRIQSIKNLRKLILENFLYKDGLKVIYKYEKEANLTFIKLRKLFASNLNFLIKNLKEKLDQASRSPELYELGKKYLNQLSALKDLNIKSEFTIKNQSLINIVVFKQKNNYLMVRVFHFMGGNLIYEYADYFFMWKDLKDIVYEFLQIYYLTHQKPKTIYTNYEIDNPFLDLNIKKPKKSEYYKKINYFLDNSFFELDEKIKNDHINKNKMNDGWLELKNLLNLTKLEEMAIIDNSFLANNKYAYGSICYFNQDGLIKHKSKTYLLNLSLNKTNNDLDCVKNLITKHFLINKNKLPDLLIVDGGINQLNSAFNILKPYSNIVGLVKEKHKTKEMINLKNQIIQIKDLNIFLYLTYIQEQVDLIVKNKWKKSNDKNII